MKYVCQECYDLIAEPFAVDGDGYYCTEECYYKTYERPDEEQDEKQQEIVSKEKTDSYTPTLDYNGRPKKKSFLERLKEV